MAMYHRGLVDKIARDTPWQTNLGQALRSVGRPMTLLAGAGPKGLGAALVGGAMVDGGTYLADAGNHLLERRVLLAIDERFESVIEGGRLDREALKAIPQSELEFLYDAEFVSRLPSRDGVELVQRKLIAIQNGEILRGQDRVLGSVEEIDEGLAAVDKGLRSLNASAEKMGRTLEREGALLNENADRLSGQQAILESLAMAQLPPEEALRLIDAGVIAPPADVVADLRTHVEVRAIRRSFTEVTTPLSDAADILGALGLGEEASFLRRTATVIHSASELAVGLAASDPIAIAKGGSSLVGALIQMGSPPEPSPEVQMMLSVLSGIESLHEKMDQYHRETMAALDSLSADIAALHADMNAGFASVELQVWRLDAAVREILETDLSTCRPLSTMVSAAWGEPPQIDVTSFRTWFDDQARSEGWRACMNGLTARAKVTSHIFRADSVVRPPSEADAVAIDALKQYEREVVVPTYKYATLYGQDSTTEMSNERLFRMPAHVCVSLPESQLEAAAELGLECPQHRDLSRSQYRPRSYEITGGYPVSLPSVARVARYAANLAPLQRLIYEDESGEERALPDTSRHLGMRGTETEARVLSQALDVLDFGIAYAHVEAGLPALGHAVTILDEHVLPESPHGGSVMDTVRAVADSVAGACPIDHPVYDTLCLMERNEYFAQNVLRGLLTRRLIRARAAVSDWPALITGWFGGDLLDVLGHDLVIRRIAQVDHPHWLKLWALEIPRATDLAEPDRTPPTGITCPSNVRKSPYSYTDPTLCLVLPAEFAYGTLMLDPTYERLLKLRVRVVDALDFTCANLIEPAPNYCPREGTVK